MAISINPKNIKSVGEIPSCLAFNTGKPVVMDLGDKKQMEAAIRKATEERPDLTKDFLEALERVTKRA
jgi:hypothetical protein